MSPPLKLNIHADQCGNTMHVCILVADRPGSIVEFDMSADYFQMLVDALDPMRTSIQVTHPDPEAELDFTDQRNLG